MDSKAPDPRSYWTRAVLRAWFSTSFASIPKFVTTALTAAVAYSAQALLKLHSWHDAMSIILTVIGSYIVVCGLSFLWNLILTPPAMEREKDKEHAAFAEAALDREPILESPEMRLTRREVAGIMPQLTAAEIGLIREMAMGRGLTEIDATIRSGGSCIK